MNITRIWIVAAAAAIIAVFAGGWFLGVQPQLAAAASSSTNLAAQQAQNRATTVRIAQLSVAAAKIDTLTARNAVLLKSVPTILKPNTFIRRVNEVAALDGVTVGSVGLGASAPYTSPSATAGTSALALGATNPLITSANFTAVPVSVVVYGTADAGLQFAHDIQNDERVFAIDGVQSVVGDAGVTTTTLSGYIYVLER